MPQSQLNPHWVLFVANQCVQLILRCKVDGYLAFQPSSGPSIGLSKGCWMDCLWLTLSAHLKIWRRSMCWNIVPLLVHSYAVCPVCCSLWHQNASAAQLLLPHHVRCLLADWRIDLTCNHIMYRYCRKHESWNCWHRTFRLVIGLHLSESRSI